MEERTLNRRIQEPLPNLWSYPSPIGADDSLPDGFIGLNITAVGRRLPSEHNMALTTAAKAEVDLKYAKWLMNSVI